MHLFKYAIQTTTAGKIIHQQVSHNSSPSFSVFSLLYCLLLMPIFFKELLTRGRKQFIIRKEEVTKGGYIKLVGGPQSALFILLSEFNKVKLREWIDIAPTSKSTDQLNEFFLFRCWCDQTFSRGLQTRSRSKQTVLCHPSSRPTTNFSWFVNPLKSFIFLIWRKYKKYIIALVILAILTVFLVLIVYTLPGQITSLIIHG